MAIPLTQITAPVVSGVLADATFVVGIEAADVINVAIQFVDSAGADIDERASVRFYLSNDANGDVPSVAAPSAGIAIGTDGAMIEWAANLSGMLTSEADGDIDIDFSEAGIATWYLVLIMPNSSLVVSPAITFA